MSNPSTLGHWLRRFLAEHIVTERNLARNTQKSYRDTFALLLPFVRARTRKPVERLALHDLTAQHVRQFLDHLESDRACSVQTRNQRLSAIRSFARFVASRDPVQIEWSASIRAIASKKAAPQPIGWLSKTEVNDLLEVPDRRTPRGRIEHALLLFLYNTGARVSEAARLVAGDLQIGRRDGGHALVNIHGKGGKQRQCPLWARTESVLGNLVRGRAPGDAVFLSRRQRP
ncbi:MAG: tyrosine-type recombinase/integrase, partial [Gammaproteobacteria bacterium]|nr:tyrosine-type recombinase/integrase [Gammaproteobacteria bacterium]